MKLVSIKDLITDKISGEWGEEPLDGQGVVVIRAANFLNSGAINFSNLVRRKIDQKKIEKKRLLSGDIIIEKSGGSPTQPVGRVVIFQSPNDDIYLCNNFTSILRPNKNEIYPEYLFYILHNNHKNGKTLRYQNKTTGIINLKLDNYLDSEIPLLSLDHQMRVAHLLGKIEGLINQRKLQLQLLDNLLKSTFLKMFGDPVSNPHEFPVKQLSEFYINPKDGTKCGPFGSALKKDEMVDSGVPVWNMDNIASDGQMILPFRMWISDDKYESLKAYSVQEGDVIISRAGTVGKMCVARMNGQPAIISTNLIRLRLGANLRPLHFVSLMLYCKGRVGRLKTGADGSFTHMNTGVLDSLELPYPPIELQDRFAAIASKVESIKALYKESVVNLETLFNSLTQQAFKGELDLSRVPLPSTIVEGEDAMARAHFPAQSAALAINLPDTDLLLPALENRENLKPLLQLWLEAYRAQLGGAAFSVESFMAAAQTRLAELHPDNDFELGADFYEHIKNWVFSALAAGTLTQIAHDERNLIQLKAALT